MSSDGVKINYCKRYYSKDDKSYDDKAKLS